MMKPKKPPAHAKPDKSPVSASEGLEATTAATKKSASKELSAKKVSLIEKYLKDLNQYSQEQAIIYQQIALTIPDPCYNFSYFALFTYDFSLFLEVSHGAAALTHSSLTHIAATLLTHCTAIVLTHSIAILIALPHWCSIYSGQTCRLFFS